MSGILQRIARFDASLAPALQKAGLPQVAPRILNVEYLI
jgi:hypothetical protein